MTQKEYEIALLKKREEYLAPLSDKQVEYFLQLVDTWDRLVILSEHGIDMTDEVIKEVLAGYDWASRAAKTQIEFENKVTRGNMKYPLESFWRDTEEGGLCFLESFSIPDRTYEVMRCAKRDSYYYNTDLPRFVTHSGYTVKIKESELEEGIASGRYVAEYDGKDFEWVND